MIEFMVLSAPRSASTWVANWLTTDTTLCLHDPVLEHAPEALDSIPIAPGHHLGIACTALGLLTDFVNAHPARKVIVHRDLDEVNESLLSIGLTRLSTRWKTALEKLGGMHVYYQDLFEPKAAERIFEHLTGFPFDAARHEQLCRMHIEPLYEQVRINPEKTRGFRDRVAEALG